MSSTGDDVLEEIIGILSLNETQDLEVKFRNCLNNVTFDEYGQLKRLPTRLRQLVNGNITIKALMLFFFQLSTNDGLANTKQHMDPRVP